MSLLKTKLLYTTARNLSLSAARPAYWNKDWKPAKYPQTEEEAKNAAKKYGLLPEEYEPIPDDGQGAGDYPTFKPEAVESKDPFYPYDFPEYRRNIGEPLHENFNLYTEDRWNINMRHKYSAGQQLAMFLGVMTGCWIMTVLGKDACFPPVAAPHLPAPDAKFYSYD